MLQDIPLIISCWFLISLWQFAALPWLYYLFKNHLIDLGWAFGRVLTWLLLGSSVWFLAHLGLPVNKPWFIYTLFLLLSAYSFYFILHHKKELIIFFKKKKKLIITEEIIFFSLFVFLSIVRGHNPEIHGLEKFMDVGFMNSYLRSPTLPLEDMWLAGEKVNYYTFGHFLGAIVAHYWSLTTDYAYNLILGLIMGLVGSQTFSLVVNFVQSLFEKTKKKKRNNQLVQVGLLATFLASFAGNGHTIWYLFKNVGFSGYWYPDATRFIERTIHEFPSYSFIVSDLHAHVWSMPLVLLLLVMIFVWLKTMVKNYDLKFKNFKDFITQPFIYSALLLGFLFGLIMSTSTWDLLIYSSLLGVLGLVLLVVDRQFWWPLFFSALAVLVALLISASPWLLNFVSISQGPRFAQEHSPFWQLLVLWGPHVLLALMSLFFSVSLFKNEEDPKKNYSVLLIVSLVLTALLLLVLPEIVYLKDIYPNHPRANTMFKLTFQAFIMMNLVIAWFFGIILQKDKFEKSLNIFLKFLLAFFIMAVGMFPYFGYRDFYHKLKTYKGLNGVSWVEDKYYSDYQALRWLRENVEGRPVIVEAVGESYTDFARISTYTGLPTIVGWRVHEWLWRGGFDIPSTRTGEVNSIYNEPRSKTTAAILKKYQVKYIFIGSKERETYENLDLRGLLTLGDVAYQQGLTAIIEVK
ncbi:MAG: DUF2298 domain-containing protein [Patescibacteria group bacterium]|nr:DUF2298 domain-containing protein [Patescibacteria group bacterium]